MGSCMSAPAADGRALHKVDSRLSEVPSLGQQNGGLQCSPIDTSKKRNAARKGAGSSAPATGATTWRNASSGAIRASMPVQTVHHHANSGGASPRHSTESSAASYASLNTLPQSAPSAILLSWGCRVPSAFPLRGDTRPTISGHLPTVLTGTNSFSIANVATDDAPAAASTPMLVSQANVQQQHPLQQHQEQQESYQFTSAVDLDSLVDDRGIISNLPLQVCSGSFSAPVSSCNGNATGAHVAPSEELAPFRLIKLIGRGAFADVYLGEWEGTKVAVKVIAGTAAELDAALPADAEWEARKEQMALMEAILLSAITHPHIVTTYQVSASTGSAAAATAAAATAVAGCASVPEEPFSPVLTKTSQTPFVTGLQQRQSSGNSSPRRSAAQVLVNSVSPRSSVDGKRHVSPHTLRPSPLSQSFLGDLGAVMAPRSGAGSYLQQPQRRTASGEGPNVTVSRLSEESCKGHSAAAVPAVIVDTAPMAGSYLHAPALACHSEQQQQQAAAPVEDSTFAPLAVPAGIASHTRSLSDTPSVAAPKSVGEPMQPARRLAPGPPPGSSFQWHMVMEFCDQGSLSTALANRLFHEVQDAMHVRWSAWAALETLIDVVKALQFLHANRIVHGDLKAANVLLATSATDRRGFVAKVSDFGLSRVLRPGHAHIRTQTYGTVTHMPPELLQGGTLSPAVDTYAFGVLMWELYTAERAFRQLSDGEVVLAVVLRKSRPPFASDTPPGYRDIAERCWSHDPVDRPTLDSLRADLEALQLALCPQADKSEKLVVQAWLSRQRQPSFDLEMDDLSGADALAGVMRVNTP